MNGKVILLNETPEARIKEEHFKEIVITVDARVIEELIVVIIINNKFNSKQQNQREMEDLFISMCYAAELKKNWIIDSGASDNFCTQRGWFQDFKFYSRNQESHGRRRDYKSGR